MRILLFLGLAALLAAPAVSAQTTFGVKLGVQAASVSFDDDTEDNFDDGDLDKRARLGFVGGLTADVPITPMLTFRPELLYSQKGVAVEGEDLFEGEGITFTQTLEADYLEVPLLLAYNVVQPSGLAFSIEAGPTVSYLLSTGYSSDFDCEGDDDFCDGFDDEDFEDDDDDEIADDLEDSLKDFDIGGALGATVGSGPFHVGVRYTLGLTDVFDDESDSGLFDDDGEWRNSAFTASLIYKFGAR